jgi:hypothetical protein
MKGLAKGSSKKWRPVESKYYGEVIRHDFAAEVPGGKGLDDTVPLGRAGYTFSRSGSSG